MERKEIQRIIDKREKTPEEMRIIAETYLNGEVLKDKVAAEAWLNKVIETGDNKDSILAMFLLAKKIWGRENIISKEDYEDIKNSINKDEVHCEILRKYEQMHQEEAR